MVSREIPDDPVEPEDELGLGPYEKADVDAIVGALKQQQPAWKELSAPLQLDDKTRWRPNLRRGTKALLHVHASPSISQSWLRRMKLATELGYVVSVAAPLDLWCSAQILRDLDGIKAVPIVVDQHRAGAWNIKREYRSIPDLVVQEKFSVGPKTLTLIGTRALDRALTAVSNKDKGNSFEEVLALLFSQVSYFEVFSRNYRNRTQEFDIVLHDRRAGSPKVVLISGKNWTEPVDSDALTSLRTKMAGRRGQCELGFLCCSRTFTSAVAIDEIGHRLANSVVVRMDGSVTRALFQKSSNLDEEVQRLITEAALG